MAIRSDEITQIIRDEIRGFEAGADVAGVGTIVEVGDGIAQVYGLSGALASELLEFPGGVMGMAFNLEEETVGALILGDYTGLKEGDQVKTTGRVVEVPVGDALIGRVVDPLGTPLDGKGKIETKKTRPVERIAPGVIVRKPVDTPVQTGIKAIDSMIPIGRGQRELIIGDRQTGKTAIAIDTIINQKGQDLVCIYVAIGQKMSTVAGVVAALEERGAMEHTIVVVAAASDPAPIQFLAPYAGVAMGEEIMDNGGDAMCVYDDLSKHAWAYRQVSLLMRRPPGREAYPGDIFYAHSRLLERAARMNEENGGGSLTALPIIETQAGDVSAYIPTNVISITDGQIFLQTDLFNQGQRPAVNAGISVSRVGGNAQIKAMRQVAGKLRLDLAQYRELAAFAQFASDLDKATRDQLTRGEKTSEILKQPQYEPLPVEKQVVIIWAVTNGYLDDVPTPKIREFETGLYRFVESNHPDLLPAIVKEKALSDELTGQIRKAIEEFREQSGLGSAKEAKEPAAKTEAADEAGPDEAGADEGADGSDADETAAGQPQAAPGQTAAQAQAEEPGPSDASTSGEGARIDTGAEGAVDRTEGVAAEDGARDEADATAGSKPKVKPARKRSAQKKKGAKG